MMDQTGIGKFISKCRKEKKLTQAQLAEKLHITDRAVYKWETGRSMPDFSIMPDLCEVLGITVNELLKGEKGDRESDEDPVVLAENGRTKSGIISILFSAVLLIGAMVCLICNIAVSGRLTWSLIPVSSAALVWIIVFPGLRLGKRGWIASLLSLSVFILPYLFLLSRLIKVGAVFKIGAVMAVPSIIFLWIIAAVFKRSGKAGRQSAWGITALLSIPFLFILNMLLSGIMAEPIVDVWDLLSVFILLILGFAFLFCDYNRKKGFVKKDEPLSARTELPAENKRMGEGITHWQS